MKRLLTLTLFLGLAWGQVAAENKKSDPENNERMAWWREARFGMFIHWGLYSIPAGAWQEKTTHGEWIRQTAQIPLEVYDQFISDFNPLKFDADEWVSMAKAAGMKYIVLTSKHHDGFCLFNSDYTDFDIMNTPFKRDILKELADACQDQGIKLCWYHSIMDWHHPDYLPRRSWEDRPADGAELDRYITYMKNQLRELVTNYGDIGVLWFDGEWEDTWNHEYGQDLYDYVRSLQPSIIINNRVDVGRSGMQGLTKKGSYAGDFGTPEQEIPPTGIPGVDWETCMTMNDHWGYNKNDNNWKSDVDLIRKLADIASKGGNFLLNVGPTAEGLFPQPSIDRLHAIGRWMQVNRDAIYGTSASPFKDLSWGRCTQKSVKGDTRLYLHVFSWPTDGQLVVPGIYNNPGDAFLLADPTQKLAVHRKEDALVINLPESAPDLINSVVVLDITGKLDVNNPPIIAAEQDIFIDRLNVSITSERDNIDIRYTLDGSTPTMTSPAVTGAINLLETTVVSAGAFRNGQPVSKSVQYKFNKVKPQEGLVVRELRQGLRYGYYEGSWDQLPDFGVLTSVKEGVLSDFDFSPRNQSEYFGFQYDGFIRLPETGIYSFFTDSDDGSQLFIGDKLVVDNDGLHGMTEETGVVALRAGFHPIRVTFFEKTGGDELQVYYRGPNIKKQAIPKQALFYNK